MKKAHLRNTIITLLLCLIGASSSYATHIIGGEMNYKCLGNNEYEISLTVYRDCFLGEAPLDDTAYVAIYDDQGVLVETLPMLLGDIDTIKQIDKCLIIPPNICVETTTYVDTITLNPRAGGYHIAYQRCCRNQTILNILDPLNTGTTYDIILSEEAMLSCNSSPILNDVPPTFICVNRPIHYNHGAFDLDGDSLVYKLCTPLKGGISIDNPRPRPAFPPPYEKVIWIAPTYGLDNVLGGTPLKIDAHTGMLTGMPNLIGQFVVGICVEEYRAGKLLSMTRRDFQYNVVPCDDVTAQFEIPESQCQNFTLSPDNQTGGTPDGFHWKIFDQKNNLILEDTLKNPTFQLMGMGNYTVRLIVNPNSICVDSTDRTINLIENSITPDFSYNIIGCTDSLVLHFNDESKDSIGEIISWNWFFNGQIDQSTSTEQNPQLTLMNDQEMEVTLQVTSDNQCVAEKTIHLTALIIPDSFSISTFDTLIVCKGDSIELNPIFNPNLTYLWSPATGLSDVTAPNPKAFPDVSTAYVLMIQDSSGNCEIRRNVFLEVIDFDTSFNFLTNTLECGDSLVLQLNPDTTYDLSNKTLTWRVQNANQTLSFTNLNPIFTISNSENIQIEARVEDQYGCAVTKIQNIQIDLVSEEIDTDLTICKGDSIALNPDFNPNYTYHWIPETFFDDPFTPNPVISPLESTSIKVEINNREGTCAIEKKLNINVINTANVLDFQFNVNACTDSLVLEITDIIIEPSGLANEVLWELNGSIENLNSSETKPIFVLKNSQDVTLSLTINPNTTCPQSINKSFRLNRLTDLDLTDQLIICQGETIALNNNDPFPDYIYEWTPTVGLDNANSSNPLASPNTSTTYQVRYTDSTQLCYIEKSVVVITRDTLPPLNVAYQVECDGRTVTFQPNVSTAITWDFGDGSPIQESQNETSISHTFPNAGDFTVNIKYSDPNICPDSQSILIALVEDNIKLNFDWQVLTCEDNRATLELKDLSQVANGTISNRFWQLSNGFTSMDINPLFTISTAETITATLTIIIDNDSQCQDSLKIEIPPLVVEEMITDTLLACTGSRMELNPSFNADYTYAWTPTTGLSDPSAPNPSIIVEEARAYTVEISNEYNCSIMGEVFTNVAPEIMIETMEMPIICEAAEVIFLAESEQVEKQWWLHENGDTLGFEPELSINIETSTTLIAVVEDQYGCQKAQDVFANFQAINLKYEKIQITCAGDNYTIQVTNLNPDQTLSYTWQPASEIIEGAMTNAPVINPTSSTNFIFTAENEYGCHFTDSIFIDIKAIPTLELSADPDTIFETESTQLIATENSDYIYEWAPANTLDDPTIFNPIAMPISTTNYTVSIMDEFGCRNTATIPIFVKPINCGFPYIFVPSGFTPNGDGENDILYVRGNAITELTFVIYDRWGDKVFETTNQDFGWNGMRNGKELPSGVFGYYLNVKCGNGQTYGRQGNITLIR